MKSPAFLLLALVLACPAFAKLNTRAVVYEHEGVKLEGWLAYEGSGAEKKPGVIVIHEWWGRDDFAKKQAEQLAQLGYVVFAIDMYGQGVTTEDPKRAGELAGQFYGKPLMASRARAGLDALLATGLVDDKRVAAVGYCFGGSTAMALAYSGAPLAGMVSLHGGPVAAPADAKGRIKTRFLICHGAVDPFISKESLDNFLRSLDDTGIDYQFISYAGAKHAFTNPKSEARRAAHGLEGIAYQTEAAHRSWGHMRQFLEEIFKN
jgi:dienelactone hydrolase